MKETSKAAHRSAPLPNIKKWGELPYRIGADDDEVVQSAGILALLDAMETHASAAT